MQQWLGPQNCLYIARILALCFAVPLHELAHALASDKLGDHTARELGRLTLNPLKHIDPMGFLAMLIVGVGWAKSVPVDPGQYKNRKLGMAFTAAMGPLANLLLAFAALVMQKTVFYLAAYGAASADVAQWPVGVSAGYYVLHYFILVNISLALFNLLPVPPLDGSRIFGLLLPEKVYFGVMRYERAIMLAMMAALVGLPYLGISPLGWLMGPASGAVWQALSWATGFADRFFMWLLF